MNKPVPAPTGYLMEALAKVNLGNSRKSKFVKRLVKLFSELPEPGHLFYDFTRSIELIEQLDPDLIKLRETQPDYPVNKFIPENPHKLLEYAGLKPYVRP